MIIGHQHIIKFLERSIKSNKISHAYLFVGPEHVGKNAIARWLAKRLQCKDSRSNVDLCQCRSCIDIERNRHPDVMMVDSGDKKVISINQIRELRRCLSLSSHSGFYKIVIIDGAERMNPEASNAFLKTLEEPRGDAVLILVANNIANLPETVISRCQKVVFRLVKEDEIEEFLKSRDVEIDNNRIKEITRKAIGRPGLAINMLNNPSYVTEENKALEELKRFLNSKYNERLKYIEKMKGDLFPFLDAWLLWFRDLLLMKHGGIDLVVNVSQGESFLKYRERYKNEELEKIIRRIIQIRSLIANTNVNPRLTMELLALEM